MAKYYGVIGYGQTVQTAPGVFGEEIIERYHYGDVFRNTRRTQSSDKINDDITVSNELSILADDFAIANFHIMRYAEFMGVKWKITNVNVSYPRLTLSLGGLYNG